MIMRKRGKNNCLLPNTNMRLKFLLPLYRLGYRLCFVLLSDIAHSKYVIFLMPLDIVQNHYFQELHNTSMNGSTKRN